MPNDLQSVRHTTEKSTDSNHTKLACNSEKQAQQAHHFSEYEKPLYRYALSLVHHNETARDAVQDTFAKFLEQDIEQIQNIKAWLYTVCRRRCYDLNARATTVQKVTAPPGSTPLDQVTNKSKAAQPPDAHLEQQEQTDRIQALIDKLPELQREAIRLKLQADLSYKQIAEVLDKNVSHVGVLIHDAMKKLRQQMIT